VGGPVGDFELLLCHGTVCVVGKMRDLILQLSKSSIYSTKPRKIDNIDIHSARHEYSEYFLREIDDEVHKHFPEYEKFLDVLRAVGTWQFEKSTFEIVLSQIFSKSDKTPSEALEELYDYSFIGFYKAGGSGYGGSEYVFKYRDSRASFSHASTRFRIHPGLIEVLGLKKV
ncbi:hypothetical protein HJ573_01550, partial [Klebsiella pneumoniae]|nr:hypothetical protein [Klebsiella pneumoniae]